MRNNERIAWIVVASILVLFLFVLPLGSRWGGFCGMMGGYSYGMMGYNTGIGFLWMIVGLALLVLLIVLIIKIMRGQEISVQNVRRKKRR